MADELGVKELRSKKKEELHELLAQTRERMRRARFDVAANNKKSIAVLRNSRRLVAQLLTLLHE